jgi:hypothetical protein
LLRKERDLNERQLELLKRRRKVLREGVPDPNLEADEASLRRDDEHFLFDERLKLGQKVPGNPRKGGFANAPERRSLAVGKLRKKWKQNAREREQPGGSPRLLKVVIIAALVAVIVVTAAVLINQYFLRMCKRRTSEKVPVAFAGSQV